MVFPAGSAHAYQKIDSNTGEVWDKALLHFPPDIRIDGHVLHAGWYIVVFQNDRMKRQIAANENITFSTKAFQQNSETGEIELRPLMAFFGSGEDAESIALSPWPVAIALRDYRNRAIIESRPADCPYEGNADDGDSYGASAGDPIDSRTGDRDAPPSTKDESSSVEEDDSFASRIKKMRALSVELGR